MERTPGFFARNSDAGFYGPGIAPETRRSPATEARSFGQVMKRMAMAGFAVAVTVSVMAPAARAQNNSAEAGMKDARSLMAIASESNNRYAYATAIRLETSGKQACFVVRQVAFTTPHEKAYVGDLTQAAVVDSMDCAVVNERNAVNKAKLEAAAGRALASGGDLDIDFLKSAYPQLTVEKTFEGAIAKAAARNAVLLDQAAEPVVRNLR